MTSRAGLTLVAHLIGRLGLTDLIERLLPRPGSNRGYSAGMLFGTLMLMLHEGGRCLDDISDFAADRLLCGDFGANTSWLMLNAIACNLLVLMRMVLEPSLGSARAKTMRRWMYDIGGRIVRHSRRWVLKVSVDDCRVLNEALLRIRGFSLLI